MFGFGNSAEKDAEKLAQDDPKVTDGAISAAGNEADQLTDNRFDGEVQSGEQYLEKDISSGHL
ncbi:MAG: hypothetical protein FWD04_02770 [Conexibacteraceae bacterium]|nr:hypothetical protein [Conexibacteraceae bacterium]